MRIPKKSRVLCRRLTACILTLTVFVLSFGQIAQAAGTLPDVFHGDAFSGSSQVIVVTNNPMGNVNATVSAYQKTGDTWNKVFTNISALIGQNGMQYDALRRQDSNTTPSGVYGIPFAFGWAQNPGTRLPYRVADSNSYWDENSGSPTYNRWVEGDPGGEREQLAAQPLYQYAIALDFNWSQTPGKGAGIFIHIKPKSYTGGCIGIDANALVQLMRWIDPAQNPKVLICPQSDFSKYDYPADSLSAIDAPAAGSTQMDTVTVQGWELARSGISRVDFYLDHNQWLGSTNQLYRRGDVYAAFDQTGYYANPDRCGYTFTFNIHTLDDGQHTLLVAGIANDGTVNWKTVSFYTSGGAITDIDYPANITYSGNIPVSGWMLNRSGQERVDFYLDNFKWLGTNNGVFHPRSDVQALVNRSNLHSPDGVDSGYTFTIPAASIGPGVHTLWAAGIGKDGTVKWSSRTFSVAASQMCVDAPNGTVSGNVRVVGWALNHAGISRVDTYLDLGTAEQKFYSTHTLCSRPDVHAALDRAGRYPGSADSGFQLEIPAADLSPGRHTVSVAAIGQDGTAQWVVRSFTVASSITDIDSPVSDQTAAGDLNIAGWALNHAGISRVDVYAIRSTAPGVFISLGSVSAGEMFARPDVAAAFADVGYPNALKSGYGLVVPKGTLSAGTYTLCVAGIGNDGSVTWQTQTFYVR